jgi:hypothetical protein
MGFTVKVDVVNPQGSSIWVKLTERLGREPTSAEAAAEVRRIIREATVKV